LILCGNSIISQDGAFCLFGQHTSGRLNTEGQKETDFSEVKTNTLEESVQGKRSYREAVSFN